MTQARDLGDAANKANFLDQTSNALSTPAGMIIPFGGTTAPTGYLACEGQIVSRSTYAALFAAIGTTWNLAGESSSQFRLPDLRGAFLRGTGTHMTHNMANGNDFAGPSVGSFENDQMQEHGHYMYSQYLGASSYSNNTARSLVDNGSGTLSGTLGSHLQAKDFLATTQGIPRGGDETRPFNAGILYCIKT